MNYESYNIPTFIPYKSQYNVLLMVYSIILFSFEHLWVFLQVILGNSTYRVYIPAISFTAYGSRDQEKPEESRWSLR